MCAPAAIPLITMAISAASAVSAHQAQSKTAKNQANAARTAYNMDNAQLERQRLEQGTQARTEMSARAKQAMVERSRLRAASAEGGIGGNSIDRIFSANEFNLGQDLAMMTENQRNVNRQSSLEGTAMQSNYQSRLNTIERPSMLNTGLQIAGIGLDGYNSYKKIK